MDRPESSRVDSRGVLTLKSEQRFLLIESVATHPYSLCTDTYYTLAQVDQVTKPGRVNCRKDLKTFTLFQVTLKPKKNKNLHLGVKCGTPVREV